MHNQVVRGIIFLILVFLVTSDLKEIFSALATTSSLGSFLSQQSSAAANSRSSSQQRYRRHVSKKNNNIPDVNTVHEDEDEEDDDVGAAVSSMKLRLASSTLGSGRNRGPEEDGGGDERVTNSDRSDPNENESLDPVKRLNKRGQKMYKKRKEMKLNEEEKKELLAMKTQLTTVMQQSCLPKLVCELHASVSERGSLTEAEKGLLSLIRETSLGTMGEIVSRYHFAAHMGQLLAGVEGNGCHNFYPNCPLSGSRVLQMMKKVRIR